MKQKVDVVILPTKDFSSHISKGKINNFLFYSPDGLGSMKESIKNAEEPQHIYFVSATDEIKENDLAFGERWSKPIQNIYGPIGSVIGSKDYIADNFKKIVATTDTSLNIPLIPEQFVKDYVTAQGNIREVWIEINDIVRAEYSEEYNDDVIVLNGDIIMSGDNQVDSDKLDKCLAVYQGKPKLTRNNEVIICKEEKDTFTKEDLKKAFEAGKAYKESFYDSFESWFNKTF